jgi:hypothetical protein
VDIFLRAAFDFNVILAGRFMFGSNVLDIAIGLIFTFLTVSLVASTVTEAIASAMSWRANTLFDGVKKLLNDPGFNNLARKIYDHGLVNSLSNGATPADTGPQTKPSYIDPKHFADAFVEVVQKLDAANQDLKQGINTIADPQVKDVLYGIVDRANGNMDQIRAGIASWFDQGMERVSGSYKRKTQLWSLIIGAVVAVVLNVDAIRIAEALWNHPMLLKGFTAPPAGWDAQHAVEQLKSAQIPFGWNDKALDEFFHNWNWLVSVPGWAMCAFATLFGAPFWFDTLQKFVRLRGTGCTPEEKPRS